MLEYALLKLDQCSGENIKKNEKIKANNANDAINQGQLDKS